MLITAHSRIVVMLQQRCPPPARRCCSRTMISVVGARLVDEIAVRVDHVGVAGQVPAVLDIDGLAVVGEVAAAGRAAHRQPADSLAVRRAGGVDHPRDSRGSKACRWRWAVCFPSSAEMKMGKDPWSR
ncbi:MAG: hypothetical protein R3F55_17835 [Alphaproteobacteria bacterium]